MSFGIDLAAALALALFARLRAGRSLLGSFLAAIALMVIGRFAVAAILINLFPAAFIGADYSLSPPITAGLFALGVAAIAFDRKKPSAAGSK